MRSRPSWGMSIARSFTGCGSLLRSTKSSSRYEKFTTSEMASATSRCATSEVRIGKRAMADYAFSLCHEA